MIKFLFILVFGSVSGKVNFVMYQYGQPDQFIHRYEYDADNRITDVLSSTDGFLWDREASYFYYLHGPLARIELGEYRVQGLDYYYTLQGWIKGVNSPTGINAQANDPGKDGVGTSTVGRDVYAYNLGYYQGDYKPSGVSTAKIEGNSLQLWTSVTGSSNSLFNGNIAWMATELAKIGQVKNNRNAGVQAMQYNYDQLHRIVRSRSLGGFDPNKDDNSFVPRTNAPAAYDEDYTYDANGNLLTLKRMNELAALQDDFNYIYYKGTNKLRSILPPTTVDTVYTGAVNSNRKIYRKITVTGNAYVPDGADVVLHAGDSVMIHPIFNKANGKSFRAYAGADGPYQYDAIGNLIADETEGVKISWTPYGKVREVKTRNDSVVVSYRYDAAGNRVEKKVAKADTVHTTRYLRDASGNVMAIYMDTVAIEQPIYGSSRLGQYKGGRKEGQRVLGKKNYELTNHLGNVLSVITDNAGMKADSVWATVVSATDYYPFGLEMKGRTFSDTTYRYGFNGKEKDNSFGDMVMDYGFRIYNPRIAKFLSVDPLTKEYPWYTPYQFAGNKPIFAVDLDGLEEKEAITTVATTTTATVLTKEAVGKMTFEEAMRFVGGNVPRTLSVAARYGPLIFLIISSGERDPIKENERYEKSMREFENHELQELEQRIERDGCIGEQEERRYVDLMQRRRGAIISKDDIYKKVQMGPMPPYENPGTHDPEGGRLPYNSTKSVIPSNHQELWENSIADPDGNKNVRWTVEGKGNKKVIHRFQSDQPDGSGTWHWNGSTNAKTKNGRDRSIPENVVPNVVVKKVTKKP
jgi:RHS repeat-associated protein